MIVIAATEYEVCRQIEAFLDGSPMKEETRTFDPATNQTQILRTKEGAVDYRFMPEPDVPSIILAREVSVDFGMRAHSQYVVRSHFLWCVYIDAGR
jgi:Asp-tRNA(Asn)/Glu-tRNA(Gln) amidotransferase B subunit